MRLYRGFAEFYSRGSYTFSERMADILPEVLRTFKVSPRTLCDIACGDGRFAIAMAQKGMVVTGVDASIAMLRYARQRARAAGVRVRFRQQFMQRLRLKQQYDCVTCWFDSLNYLLTKRDLKKAFRNVHHVLKPHGLFIFDVNTIYGLSVVWYENSPSVIQDTRRFFEVHITMPKLRNNIVPLKILGFKKQGKTWQRMEEIHKERGYTLRDIRACFKTAKFRERAAWGNINNMTKPTNTSGKVWFVLQK